MLDQLDIWLYCNVALSTQRIPERHCLNHLYLSFAYGPAIGVATGLIMGAQ